jgi:hypothetical protein
MPTPSYCTKLPRSFRGKISSASNITFAGSGAPIAFVFRLMVLKSAATEASGNRALLSMSALSERVFLCKRYLFAPARDDRARKPIA